MLNEVKQGSENKSLNKNQKHHEKTKNIHRDLNLVTMLLGLESNKKNDINIIISEYNIYSQIDELKISPKFKNSLAMSKEILTKDLTISDALDKLNKNEPDTFLIVPLQGKGHLFSALIRSNENGFSLTVVNKGSRFLHESHEEFVIGKEKKKILTDILDPLMVTDNKVLKPNVEDIYKGFIAVADKSYSLNVIVRNQKTGNCYSKNVEAAIKYAQSTMGFTSGDFHRLRGVKEKEQIKDNGQDKNKRQDKNKNKRQDKNKKQNKNNLQDKNNVRNSGNEQIKFEAFKVKWKSLTTLETHRLFVQKFTANKTNLAKEAMKEFEIYEKNKLFGESIEAGKSSLDSLFTAFKKNEADVEKLESKKIKDSLHFLTMDNHKRFKSNVKELVHMTKDDNYIKAYEDLVVGFKIFTYEKKNDGFNKFMEAGIDPLKSFQKIFPMLADSKATQTKDAFCEKLCHINVESLIRYESSVKKILSKIIGEDNIKESYKNLLNESILKGEKIKEVKNSIESNWRNVILEFPHPGKFLKEKLDLENKEITSDINSDKKKLFEI